MDRCDAALVAWSRLQVVYAHLSGEVNRTLYRETGLSEADAAVLIALLESPDPPLHSFQLRCELAWEKSRLSHQLRRMEARGLIERAACPDDARTALIQLTPAGRERAVAARAVLGQAIQALLAGALTGEQLDQLATMTEVLLAHMERSRSPQP